MASELRTLGVVFEGAPAFEREYAANISKGGIFIETAEAFAIREKVRVNVQLHYASKNIKLDGEVVHVVTPAIATAGAKRGVAVHFEASAAALRQLFAPLVESTAASPTAADHDDRRAAERSRARLSARVHCPGCDEIVGRTRDLSITGVLVSMEGGEPIGIGEPVEVFIANPETGREQEILGRVVRHVPGYVAGEGGAVHAIGIQFHIPLGDRAAIELFLQDLAALEHTRHLGGIKGTIEEVGLINLVQTFGLAAHEGTLDVTHGNEEGYVAFQNGSLRAASLGSARGVKALARMLGWSHGSFEFHARIDPALPEFEPISMEGALLAAMQEMDERGLVNRASYPPDAELRVDGAARAASGPFEKLEDAVLDLAAARMNVKRILDIVPATDGEIYLALESLVERGILEVSKV